jgi:uncharacterized membrane protein YgaE (UPF0421/DUF939 family)
MNQRNKGLLIYILKCAIGTITVFSISSLIHYKNVAWSLISVLLVLSPEGKDAISLAVSRIKANVIGAAAGLACLPIAAPNMWTISLAIAATLFLCHLLNLDAAARSALAASVIIMLHPEGSHLWSTAIERLIAVFSGCALGLAVTFMFHLPYRSSASNVKPDPEAAD